jgi:phytoene dehydrogenase-like protein
VDAFRRAGGEAREGVRVESIEADGGRVRGVRATTIG